MPAGAPTTPLTSAVAASGAGETQDARDSKRTDECDDSEAGVTCGETDGRRRSYRDEPPDWTHCTVHWCFSQVGEPDASQHRDAV